MDGKEPVRVLTWDFSALSQPENQKVLEESKEESRGFVEALQEAHVLDQQELLVPCTL